MSTHPTRTLRGHEFNNLRARSDLPTRRPLTDFPVAAYVMAAVFDVISTIGRDETFATDFFRAGTYVMVSGGAIYLLADLTGLWGWLRSADNRTKPRRTPHPHTLARITVTVFASADVALRLAVYGSRTHPTASILILSILVALLVSSSAAFGGTVVSEPRYYEE